MKNKLIKVVFGVFFYTYGSFVLAALNLDKVTELGTSIGANGNLKANGTAFFEIAIRIGAFLIVIIALFSAFKGVLKAKNSRENGEKGAPSFVEAIATGAVVIVIAIIIAVVLLSFIG